MFALHAGHVGISARHSNHFRVSVNTEAHASVVFFLLYEELLQRRAGIYEHVINLTPRQKLKDFAVEVSELRTQTVRSSLSALSSTARFTFWRTGTSRTSACRRSGDTRSP